MLATEEMSVSIHLQDLFRIRKQQYVTSQHLYSLGKCVVL